MGEKGTHLRERLLVLCERRRQPRLLSLQLGPPRQERLKHRPRLVACHARQQLALLASQAGEGVLCNCCGSRGRARRCCACPCSSCGWGSSSSGSSGGLCLCDLCLRLRKLGFTRRQLPLQRVEASRSVVRLGLGRREGRRMPDDGRGESACAALVPHTLPSPALRRPPGP